MDAPPAAQLVYELRAVLYAQKESLDRLSAALEREAGTRLVERSARGVRLTDAGRALVAHTDVILARLDPSDDRE